MDGASCLIYQMYKYDNKNGDQILQSGVFDSMSDFKWLKVNV